MRVLHIIPSAFDYFGDIRAQVFGLIDKEREYGIEVEAFTLQYGAVTRGQKSEIKSAAPRSRFIGTFGINELVGSFDEFDIVHLHCPFLGAAGRILKWKKNGGQAVLVATYHRDFKISDLFSIFIAWYNVFYLPRIFDVAGAVVCFTRELFESSKAKQYLRRTERFFDLSAGAAAVVKDRGIHLTGTPDNIKLTKADAEALAYIKLYKKLLLN